MTWGAPEWLFGLAAPAAIALATLFSSFARRRESGPRWPRVSRVLASTEGLAPVPAKRSNRRPWLILAGTSLAIAALARPQWGDVEERVVEQAHEVMIALDLSRSMLVDDVSPTRLERARLLVRSLLDHLRGERVGLIVFAGTAFVQVPLSADYEIFREFLPEMTPDYMPQGGTDYDAMLRAALEAFGEAGNVERFLIVLSDGESTAEDWRQHLPELEKRKLRAITLGIGTAQGGLVPDPKSGYIKDARGAVVLSRLESGTLQELAAKTRGTYREASVWVDLPRLLNETVALGQLRSFEEERRTRREERFQWLLAPAVLLAALGIWREFSVRPATRTVPVRVSGGRIARAVSTASLLILGLTIQIDNLPAAEAPESPAAQNALRDTVARISSQPTPTAADWRTMAEQTLAVGEESKTAQQPVPPDLVHDALAAVERGEQLDPNAADWPGLRARLNALLQSEPAPEQPPPDEPPPEEDMEEEQQDSDASDQQNSSDESQQQQSEQEQQSQDSGASQEQQQSDSSSPQESDADQPGDPSRSPSDSNQQSGGDEPPDQPNNRPPPEGSRLGDVPDAEQPDEQQAAPQPAEREAEDGPRKKFGGRPAGKAGAEPMNAQEAAALQELLEVLKRDAPARLFQQLEGEPAQGQQGPDW